MTQDNQKEILDIISYIRNKLGSFWTLSSLVLMENDNEKFKNLIKETAQISEEKKSIINEIKRYFYWEDIYGI